MYYLKRGFTLIELLVVISIIGVLASTVLATLSSVRAKSRDSTRISDMRQMQTMLELYYSEHGVYPGTTSWVRDCGGEASWSNLFDSAFAEYVPEAPNDPLFPNNPWPYCDYYKLGDYHQCTGTGHAYTILFLSESSVFSVKKYNIQGEGGAAARYCIHQE